jgi:hypothetical protein
MKKVIFVCHDDDTFRAYNKLLLAAVFDDTKSPVADMISAHLLMIESAHQIRIRNKEEIVQVISEVAENNIQALSAVISVNNWIAAAGVAGDVRIPHDVLIHIRNHITMTDHHGK